MIDTIISATDFSAPSRKALDYAAALARKTGGHLIGASVLPNISAYSSPTQPVPTSHSSALSFFEYMSQEKKMEIEPQLLLGTPERALLELAAKKKADLLVVARHSRATVGEGFIGSTTERLLRQATSCPILIVPPEGTLRMEWHPLVVATDFSSTALLGFRLAIGLARNYEATLRLVHVLDTASDLESVTGTSTDYLLNLSGQAEKKLLEMIQEEGSSQGTDSAVIQGKPVSLILQSVDEANSDLLIVGKQGQNLAGDQPMVGSTTTAILRSAHFPVMVVPSPAG